MLTAQIDAQLKELLRKNAVFSILDDRALDNLTSRMEMANFGMGEMIVNEGEAGECAYLLYSGRVRVFKRGEAGKPVTLGSLGPGDLFGERALMTGEPRSASIRASEDCVLFRIARSEFDLLLSTFPELRDYFDRFMSERAVIDFLRSATFIGSLPAAEVTRLLDRLQTCAFAEGDVIVREGDPGDKLFLITSGEARVTRQRNGDVHVLSVLGEGQYFGERALIRNEPRSATVTAVKPTHCLSLSSEDFAEMVAAAPHVHEQFSKRIEQYTITEEMQAKFGLKPPAPERRRQLSFVPASAAARVPEPGAKSDAAATAGPEGASGTRQQLKKGGRGLFGKYPFIPQLDEMDCGAASLAMVSKYYGIHMSVGRLREIANVGREGASLYSLSHAAEKIGYTTRAVRTDFENLLNLDLPAVAHWMGYHYIVLYEVRHDRVVVGDPAIGIVKMSRKDFEAGWTGRLLLLTPTTKLEENPQETTTFRRFLPLLYPYRFLLFEILLASLVIDLLQLASPIFTQTIVDKVLVHRNVSMLNLMLGGMIIVGFFQTATSMLRQYLLMHVSQKLELKMSSDLFRQLMRLPMRFFHTRHIGDLLQRFQDNDRLQQIMTSQVISTLLDMLMLLTSLSLMLYYNSHLTAVALIPIPAYIILTLVFTPILKRLNQKEFEQEAKAESSLIESINSVAAIKACTAERTAQWKHEDHIVRAANIEIRSARAGMQMTAISSGIQLFSSTFLMWYGAMLVIRGDLSVGQLMAFQSLIGMVTTPIMGLIGVWDELHEAMSSLKRLSDLYDAKPEVDSQRDAMRLPPLRGSIKFENVSFRYSSDGKDILSTINLEVEPGTTVALVGRSGSGKTTLVTLLQRFYDPSEGRILVDGFDLATVDVRSFREQVGIVSQESTIFSGTIRENIALADPDAGMDRIIGTAKLANAHDFIMALPMGYETVVGEAGVRLSGGQKQRVCIARALLKDPRIIIFDEATSALDTESEKVIQENMKPILHQRTAFVIAHRLSTVQDADTIVVLDDGQIIEKGSHHELIDKKGLYYYLVSQQLTM